MSRDKRPYKKKTQIDENINKQETISELLKQKEVQRKNKIYLIILLAVNILVFGKILWFNYIDLDDVTNIVENNGYFKDFNNFFKGFSVSFIATFYRPLLWGSWIIDAQFEDVSNIQTIPFYYHLTNLLLHLGCVFMLYKLLKRLSFDTKISFYLVLFFSVHPLFVQAIGWIAGRNDTLLTLFVLISVYFFIKYCEKNSIKYLALHFLFYVIALFTKETAVGIPVVCWFLMYSLSSVKVPLIPLNKKFFILVGFWLVITLIWYNIRQHALQACILEANHIKPTEGIQYNIKATGEIVGWEAFIQNFSFMFEAVGKFIFPLQLSVYAAFNNAQFLIGILSYIILIALTFFLKIDLKKWGLALVWWLVFLIPPMLIVFTDNRYDYLEHRIYTPAIGIVLLLGYIINKLNQYFLNKWLWLFIPVIIFFCGYSYSRLDSFSNPESFYLEAIRSSPSKPNPYRVIADYYNKNNQPNLAINYYKILVEKNPNDLNLIVYIASQYVKERKFDSARYYYNMGLQQGQPDYEFYTNYADFFDKSDKIDSADYFYRKAMLLKPSEWIPYHNIAYYSIQKEQYDSALKYYNKVIALDPNQINSIWGLGVVFVKKNRVKDAIDILTKGITIRPDYKECYVNLIHIYIGLNDFNNGRKIYNQAFKNGIDLHEVFPMFSS